MTTLWLAKPVFLFAQFNPVCPPSPPDDTLPHLSAELAAFATPIMASYKPFTERARTLLLWVHQTMTRLFPGCGVYVSGSTRTGLCSDTSDVDAVIMLPSQVMAKRALKAFSGVLHSSGRFENVVIIRHARVPIARFVDRPTGLGCDISFTAALAIENSALLADYCALDACVRPLALCIKHWAKMRQICDASAGTLSSYAYMLLLVQFLQVRGVLPCLQRVPDDMPRVIWAGADVTRLPVDPAAAAAAAPVPRSLGELLRDFFAYYAALDWARLGVSVRCGAPVPRPPGERKPWWIEDPFERAADGPDAPHINLYRSSDPFGAWRIRLEMERAAGMLGAGAAWAAVCEPVQAEQLQAMRRNYRIVRDTGPA